ADARDAAGRGAKEKAPDQRGSVPGLQSEGSRGCSVTESSFSAKRWTATGACQVKVPRFWGSVIVLERMWAHGASCTDAMGQVPGRRLRGGQGRLVCGSGRQTAAVT